MAQEKLESLERQIVELQALRDQMQRMLADWDTRLAQASDGAPAFLLESLTKEMR
jgi:hypothetical protein